MMRLSIHNLTLAIALSWTVGCGDQPPPVALREITILVTTDLHGHLEHAAMDDTTGGWLRLTTLIRRERAACDAQRTLLIDCGDTTQGTFAAADSQGEISLIALKTLGYDIWVPGNHEFDYGLSRLREFTAATSGVCLAGNLEIAEAASVPLKLHNDVTSANSPVAIRNSKTIYRRLPTWKMFTRNQVRIAVIGVTASYLDQWFRSGDSPGYRVEKALATVTRVLPEIHRAKPDVIVLAAHQGWLPNDPRNVNELAEIAKRFPEIDLVLGGHTHQPFPGQKIGFKTWYVQADCQGSALGVVKLSVDTTRHEVVDAQSELRTAGAEMPYDPALDNATRASRQHADALARKRLTTLTHATAGEGTPGTSCQTAELIANAMMHATGARAAFHGKFTDGGLRAGPVTEFDLYRLLPFENGITVAQLTPDEIGQIAAEQRREAATSPKKASAGVSKVNGLYWRAALPVTAGSRIPVAFNSYVAAGGGGRFPVLRALLRQPAAQTTDSSLTTRDALRRFLTAK